MIFHLTADCTFEAKNLDNAFEKLAFYFWDTALLPSSTPTILRSGEIKLKPLHKRKLIREGDVIAHP